MLAALASLKSTLKGTQPETSLGIPLMVDTISEPTPAKLNAIFIAASLQPVTVPLLCVVPFFVAQTPGVVGKFAPP